MFGRLKHVLSLVFLVCDLSRLALHPRQRFAALSGFENPVTDEGQDRAFEAGEGADPGLVGDDCDAAEAVELAEQRQSGL